MSEVSYAFLQLNGNKANLNTLTPGVDVFDGQLIVTKDSKEIFCCLDGEIQLLGSIYTGTSEPTGAERGKVWVSDTVKRYDQATDSYVDLLKSLKDKDGEFETRIEALEAKPTGDTVTDSTTNGNIILNGSTEFIVYDDTALKNLIAGKQDAGDYATKTELADGLATKEPSFTHASAFNKDFAGSGTADSVARSDHNHGADYAAKASEHTHTNKADLDRLGVSTNSKLTIDGVEQAGGSTGPAVIQASPYFTGNSSTATNSSSSKWNGVTQFTIELWFKAVPGQTQKYLFNKNSSASQLSILFGYGGATQGVELNGQNGLRTGTLMQLDQNDNQWHHIVYAYDQVTVRGYLGGVLKVNQAQTVAVSLTSTNMYIGTASNTNFFIGSITEFRFWKEARSEADILANWNKRLTNPKSFPTLISYIPNTNYFFGGALIDESAGTAESFTFANASWSQDVPPFA